MNKLIISTLLVLSLFQNESIGQNKYGNTLNVGLGIGGHYGYYRYAGSTLPILHLDYEFDVAKNLTLAPSINLHSFNRPFYRETGIAAGIKGFWYLDDLLKTTPKWDIYLAGTVGFMAVNSRWEENYNGNRDYYKRLNPVFLDFHVGAEYHINERFGVVLDISTGASTIGFAIH